MKDSVREAWLTDNGWEFEYEEKAPLDFILVDKSAQEQVRLGEQVDELHASRLAQALRDGAQFPAVILIQPTNGGPLPIGDGIHRISALKKIGRKETDAYVVTNAQSPKMTEMLRRTANAPGGKGFDTAHAVQQAVALTDAGWNASEAARMMHVSSAAVSKRLRAREIAPKVAKVMAPMTTARVLQVVPQDTLEALARIKRADLFDSATRIVMHGKLSGKQADVLAQEAMKALTDAAAVELMTDWNKTYASELAQSVRGSAAAQAIRNQPKVRLDRSMALLKTTITTIKNNVDGRKLDADSKRNAADVLRWASGELVKMARRIADGKSAASD